MKAFRSALVLLTGVATAVSAFAAPALASSGTGSISGVVVDTRGTVVAGADISLYVDPSGDPQAVAETDSTGHFAFSAVNPGSYDLLIGLGGGWSAWAPGRDSGPTAYTVTAGHVTRADSVVYAAGHLTGAFTSTAGDPIPDAWVTATGVDNARDFTARTTADGTYTLAVEPNETYIVTFATGPVWQYYPHTFDQSAATRFTVRPGRTVHVSDTAIPPAQATGLLTDAAGAPVAGALVTFTNVETTVQYSRETDTSGVYTVDALPPAVYKVSFTTGGVTQYAYRKLDWDSADTVTLTSGTVTTVNDQLLP